MRHQMRGRKFNRPTGQRYALLRGLAGSLIEHEQIQTTLEKAKDLRPFVEKLVTLARHPNTLHARRQALSVLNNNALVTKLITTLAERYKNRPGGYLRIVKTGFRLGDNANTAIIEFVDRDPSAKGASAPQKSEISQTENEATSPAQVG